MAPMTSVTIVARTTICPTAGRPSQLRPARQRRLVRFRPWCGSPRAAALTVTWHATTAAPHRAASLHRAAAPFRRPAVGSMGRPSTWRHVAAAPAEWPGLGGGQASGADPKPAKGSPPASREGKGKKKSGGGGGEGRRKSTATRDASSSSSGGRGKGRRPNRGRGSRSRRTEPIDVTADGSTSWRLFDLKLPLDVDPGKDSFEVTPELRRAAQAMLGLPTDLTRPDGSPLLSDLEDGRGVRVVRKSCDARSIPPVFSYIVDVDDVAVNSATVASGSIKPLQIRARPKKCERVSPDWNEGWAAVSLPFETDRPEDRSDEPRPLGENRGRRGDARAVVVGLGPAGLFAALALAEAGAAVTVLERGQPVEGRGRDIGALFARRVLDADSNLCFGEGGAGTWSDGKLTTRIGRNSSEVRAVLNALVAFGAPPEILVTGKPHLGTDRLVRILRNARGYLASRGVELRFGVTVERVLVEKTDEGGRLDERGRELRTTGVRVKVNKGEGEGAQEIIPASAVVLAAGHSARGLFEGLHEDGVALKYQSFAAGFRIEHPQALLDELQYGADLARLAAKGKGPLPVADYRLAHQCVGPGARGKKAEEEEKKSKSGSNGGGWDENTGRACYSFCMCPGGQIVPTSVVPEELCVNGMSFSKRSSNWANSGLVSTITEADAAAFASPGREALAGLDFQRHIERKAAEMGGGDLVVPVQTAPDFIAGRESDPASLPASSYRLGVRSARLDLLYPPEVTAAVRESLVAFDAQLPGYAGPLALLHAPEARTSSPVRVVRSKEDMQSETAAGLFPIGEGAGYAGGIVSAAVDGLLAAEAVAAFVRLQSSA